jgi:hypothetical protein
VVPARGIVVPPLAAYAITRKLKGFKKSPENVICEASKSERGGLRWR